MRNFNSILRKNLKILSFFSYKYEIHVYDTFNAFISGTFRKCIVHHNESETIKTLEIKL